MGCRDCHAHEYDVVPHHSRGADPFRCVVCHERKPAFSARPAPSVGIDPAQPSTERVQLPLSTIAQDVRASVHYRKLRGEFGCGDCHDIHLYVPLAAAETARARIAVSNAVCARCHDSAAASRISDSPASEGAHGFLVNPRLHLDALKCVACHASGGHEHQIGEAKDAVRKCDACHAADSAILKALYSSPGQPTRAAFIDGFTNSAVLDEAYVIGATRNRWLDGLGLGLVGVVFVGAFAHGLCRAWYARCGRHRVAR